MSKQDTVEGYVKEPRTSLTEEQELDIENRRKGLLLRRAKRYLRAGNAEMYQRMLNRL